MNVNIIKNGKVIAKNGNIIIDFGDENYGALPDNIKSYNSKKYIELYIANIFTNIVKSGINYYLKNLSVDIDKILKNLYNKNIDYNNLNDMSDFISKDIYIILLEYNIDKDYEKLYDIVYHNVYSALQKWTKEYLKG